MNHCCEHFEKLQKLEKEFRDSCMHNNNRIQQLEKYAKDIQHSFSEKIDRFFNELNKIKESMK